MRRIAFGIMCVVTLFACAGAAFAEESPFSARLVEDAALYDGTEIEFTGEVIGEVMYRGDGAWVHLNDDAYMERNVEEDAALGGLNSGQAVWVPEDLARAITRAGDYHNQGDIVRVRGIFNAACPEHGGDMDIHAEELVVLTPGHAVVDPVATWKPLLALGLGTLAALLFTRYRWHGSRA